MMIAILVVVVLTILAVMYWQSIQDTNKQIDNENDFFENGYVEDIDFSLAIKGYPVVNDYDIAYTNWTAQNPSRIRV